MKKVFLGLFILSFLVLYLTITPLLTLFARHSISQWQSDQLKIDLQSLSLSNFTPTFTLKNLKIYCGNKEQTLWTFHIKKIVIKTDWRSLFNEPRNINDLMVLGADVKLSEKRRSQIPIHQLLLKYPLFL